MTRAGGGQQGGAYIVKLRNGLKGIFRPGAERAKKEVAASRFAKAAGFDSPDTAFATINGRRGSLQLFLPDLPTAAPLNMQDRKFASGLPASHWRRNGGIDPNPTTRVFDALIANKDRNLSNYLIRPDSSQVLFDHEKAFHPERLEKGILVDAWGRPVTVDTVRSFVADSPVIASRLANGENEEFFLNAVSDLNPGEISAFRERLRALRQLIEAVQKR